MSQFYRAFEEKFRGPRSLILSRLMVYQPYIDGLTKTRSGIRGLDLGCGRGEWLEFLSDQGIRASGVDLDAGMLQACRERGFDVVEQDVFAFLAKQLDNSQDIVSGFHIVEHFSFDDLQKLISEAQRVLRPGGVLILETPNPENIYVSTLSFHYDPTHNKPLPPNLLAFLVEYAGFARVKVERVNENEGLKRKEALSIEKILKGVSPDYAIIAQNAGDSNALNACDEAFKRSVADDSSIMMNRFDEKLEALAKDVERLKALSESYEKSLSWRVTLPLRLVSQRLKWITRLVRRRTQRLDDEKRFGSSERKSNYIQYVEFQSRRVYDRLPARLQVSIKRLTEALIKRSQKKNVPAVKLSARGQVILQDLKDVLIRNQRRPS